MAKQTMYLVYDVFDNLEMSLEKARSSHHVLLKGKTAEEWTLEARNRCALILWGQSDGWDGMKYPANPRIVMEIPLETDGGLPATMGADPEWISQFTVEAESYDDPVTQMVLEDISQKIQPGGLRRRFEVAYLIASDCVVHDEKTGDLIITDKGRACLDHFADARRG